MFPHLTLRRALEDSSQVGLEPTGALGSRTIFPDASDTLSNQLVHPTAGDGAPLSAAQAAHPWSGPGMTLHREPCRTQPRSVIGRILLQSVLSRRFW